jgi:hypothetical protein
MLAPTDSYVSGKRNFIKRVTISHKQNIVIGGLHSRTSVKMTKKVINQHFCCLKRNIEVTETDCYIRYKNTKEMLKIRQTLHKTNAKTS